jgi:hypothetical protein
MSYTTDLVIEMMEDDDDRENNWKDEYVAELLGIRLDELLELDCQKIVQTSKDGELYHWCIEFDEDSPREILDKITRMEQDGYHAHLHAWELERDDSEFA